MTFRRPVKFANKSSRRNVSSSRRDKRDFSKTADMIHGENLRQNPLRGGYRL